MLTPSPCKTPSSSMTSSTLMPMRICKANGSASFCPLRCARWTSAAHRTAFTTLPNSTSTASPAIWVTRPPCRSMCGSMTSVRSSFQRRSVSTSLRAISREKPATSAKAIAASRRLMLDGASARASPASSIWIIWEFTVDDRSEEGSSWDAVLPASSVVSQTANIADPFRGAQYTSAGTYIGPIGRLE